MKMYIEKQKRYLGAKKCFAANAIKYVLMALVMLQIPVSYAFKAMTFNVGTTKYIAQNSSDNNIHPDWDQSENFLGTENTGMITKINDLFFGHNLAWIPAEENVKAFIERAKPEIISFQELYDYSDCTNWHQISKGMKALSGMTQDKATSEYNRFTAMADQAAADREKLQIRNEAIDELLYPTGIMISSSIDPNRQPSKKTIKNNFVCGRDDISIPQMKRILGDDYYYLWSKNYTRLGVAVRKDFGRFVNPSDENGLTIADMNEEPKSNIDAYNECFKAANIKKADCFLNDSGMLAYNKDTKKHYFDQNSGRVAYIDIVPNYYDENDPKNKEIIRVIATHAPAQWDNNSAILPRRHLFSRMFKKGTKEQPAFIQHPNQKDIETIDDYTNVPRTHVFMGDFNTDHNYLCNQNGIITPDDSTMIDNAGGGDEYGDYSACRLHEYFSGTVKGYPQVYNLTKAKGDETHYPTNIPADIQYDYVVTDKLEYSTGDIAHNKLYDPVKGNFDHVPVVGEIRRPWSDYDYSSSVDGAVFWGEFTGNDSDAGIVSAQIEAIEDEGYYRVENAISNYCSVENGFWQCKFLYNKDRNVNPIKFFSHERGLYTAYIKYTSKSGNVGVQPIRFRLNQCETAKPWEHTEGQPFNRVGLINNKYYAVDTTKKGGVGDFLGNNIPEFNNKEISLENRGYKYQNKQLGGWAQHTIWKQVHSCQYGVPNIAYPPEVNLDTVDYDYSSGELTVTGTASSKSRELVSISGFMPMPVGGINLQCSGTSSWSCKLNQALPPMKHGVVISAINADGKSAYASKSIDLTSIKTTQNGSKISMFGDKALDADSIIVDFNGKAVICDGASLSNCEIDLSSIKKPGQYTVEITVQNGNYTQTFTVPVNIDMQYIPIKAGNISIIVPKAKLVQ